MNAFEQDNPNLTAYALGELDAVEAAVVESQLRDNPALHAELAEIRRTTAMLSEQLAAEIAPGLTARQRHFIQQRPEPRHHRPLIFRARPLWLGAGLAAAACFMFAVLMWPSGSPSLEDQVALTPSEERDRQMQPGDAGLADFTPRSTVPNEAGAMGYASSLQDVPDRFAEDSNATATGRFGVDRDVNNFGGGGGGGGGNGLAGAGTAPASPTSDGVHRSVTDSAPARMRPAVDRVESVMPDTASAGQLALTKSGGTSTSKRGHELAFDAGSGFRGEQYATFAENPFVSTSEGPSSFSVDVDTASYTNVRRYLNNRELPPRDAVRIEEMVNYFSFDYEAPSGGGPFRTSIEINAAPWNPEHALVRIGLRGKDVRSDMRPPTSLVFLIDVSGSMNQPNKLPFVQSSLKQLVNALHADDRIAMVTYAGHAGIVQEPMYCTYVNKPLLQKKIDELKAGGSTNGAGGISAAYDLAAQSFIKGGVNRVILCTDGDFNVGASSEDQLIELIQRQRSTGVYLSVLGFGSGNLQEGKMQALAAHGNGHFAYIDKPEEGKRVLVDHLSGTLVTIAKDVKAQVEFNADKISAYRLIGYENRVMSEENFQDKRVDAGEIGAGHTVTALYEIVPIEPLGADEQVLALRLRYKSPEAGADDPSEEVEVAVSGRAVASEPSPDFQFASAVAAFGMILRDSPHKGQATIETVLASAEAGLAGTDFKAHQSRREFIQLVMKAKPLLEAHQPQGSRE